MQWTDQEKNTLRELYPVATKSEIAQLMGRSSQAVRGMVLKLGLTKRPASRPWSAAEIQALRMLFPSVGAVDTAQALGRPLPGTRGMAYRLGLRDERTLKALPIGTERMMRGTIFRKVSMDRGRLQNWRPVSQLEQSPEVLELYQLLAQIEGEVKALAQP